MTSRRDYDVVLYGAGGFTGRQTVAYFTKHAPAGLRWAIAGPRLHTLEAARRDAGGSLNADAVLIANSTDQRAVDCGGFPDESAAEHGGALRALRHADRRRLRTVSHRLCRYHRGNGLGPRHHHALSRSRRC